MGGYRPPAPSHMQVQIEPDKVLCSKCERQCPPEDMAKQTRGKPICTLCSNKRAMLSKMFGKWPIEPFKELPKDVQTQFWQCDKKTNTTLQNELITHVAENRIKHEKTNEVGAYRPLSVYKNQGYSQAELESIEKNCPSKDDEQLDGVKVYKYTVTEEIKGTIKQQTTHMIINMRDQSLRGKLSHYCSPPSKRKRSSSSSSSSSSGSNSEPPTAAAKAKAAAAAKKLAKEAADAKKRAAKEELDQKREQAKAAKQEAAALLKQSKADAAANAKQEKAAAAANAKAEAKTAAEEKKVQKKDHIHARVLPLAFKQR